MDAPFGSWRSPITAEVVGGKSLALQEVAFDGDDLLWTEIRPAEKGRAALVRRRGGRIDDLLPAPFDARTRVYEYGGGAFLALPGRIVFSSYADGRLWEAREGAAPRPLTPEGERKHSDLSPLAGGRAAIAIVEEGRRHFLGRVDLERGGAAVPVVEGRDFYFSPRVSPDGTRLAWIEWSHPDMPWDGTELFVGTIDARGEIRDRRKIAGSRTESVCEPRWSPDGRLAFATDRSGWWNLWMETAPGRVEPLAARDAEFAQAPWTSDSSSWSFAGPDAIVCARREGGFWTLGRLDLRTRELSDLELPFDQITDVRATPRAAAFFAGSARHPWSLVRLDLESGRHEVVRESVDVSPFARWLSGPERVDFPTAGGKTAHAFFYAPRNPDFTSAGKPPLIVIGHGGPTAHTFTTVRLDVQFFTSRGFAVLDVDYGGSAGWGREYRERLAGAWGIVDVEDCVNAARHVAERGMADGKRMAIRGGSAGGYTVLCALTFHPGSFQAGASHYGVSDLAALARDTHEFEARYLDKLVGPWPAAKDVYEARSPLSHVDRLSTPVIFFQGLDDRVVPPAQTESMVAALRARGIPVAYLPFEGEQHGFRKAENRKRALEAELFFYGRLFGFTPADPIDPVSIDNLS